MKKEATFVLLLLLLSPVGSDRATSALGGAPADEETVRSLDDQERKAVLDGNFASLEHLWCEQLTVNSPANNVVIGRHDVLARVQKSGVYSSFERKIEFIRIDGNFAIIMGAETVQPIGDARLAGKTVQRRFTNIWKKDGNTWCAIARHANVVSAQ
jgi:ketosteroid isomerase-like protein